MKENSVSPPLVVIPVDQLENLFSSWAAKYIPNVVQNSIKNKEPEGKMSQREAAEFIGKTVQTLITYRKKYNIPCYSIGSRHIKYYKSELLEFMKNKPDLFG